MGEYLQRFLQHKSDEMGKEVGNIICKYGNREFFILYVCMYWNVTYRRNYNEKLTIIVPYDQK